MKLAARSLALVVATLLVVAAAAGAQPISLTTLGSAYTQDFDTLASAGTSSTVPAGWAFAEALANANTTYTAGTGSGTAGDTYSFGVAAAADRAFGGLQSGTLNPTIGASFTNNTGSTIASLDISYTGEQWRIGTVGRTDRLDFQYSTDATSLTTGTWIDVDALDFTAPNQVGPVGALNGNAAGNFTLVTSSIPTLSIASGSTFWIRWTDFNGTGADDGLAVDTFSLTPQGAGAPTPSLSINDVSLDEGDAGTTNFSFTVSLSEPVLISVTFDIATADGTAQDDNPPTEDNDYVPQTLVSQTIPPLFGLYTFTVVVNGDLVAESNETFFVNVTNVTGVAVADGQGQGTIRNDDIIRIHDVQGPGAATPIPGATVTVEGVVIADFQAGSELSGFFIEEEDADFDADPATSEGIFVFCGGCPTAVNEGQVVRVTGVVSEFFDKTEITATTAGGVVVVNAGNNLALVTPVTIDLPIVGLIDGFYEPLEGMRVTFSDTLTVAEYFEMARYGQIELYEGGRPFQFTEANAPSVPGYAAHLDDLARRRVILDDDDNAQNSPLALPDGSQFIYHPRANGGLSVGTQGVDFFRGGDTVSGLTGVLDWSFAGFTGTDAWRVRPTAASPVAFTATNLRPATPPAVGGAIRVASLNLLNYFSTVDTGPDICGPAANQDCRGADSVAELNRQRERTSIVICGLNADVVGAVELENTASATINDLLGAVNARCGGAHPYAAVSTGGTLGTDAIRVVLFYRTGVLSPVGPALVDLDPVHNRPPTAQTFDVVDATNPAFGQRFTAIANHFKSKGCGGATGPDLDQNDGAGCFNASRTAQATRLLTWINGAVIPAAGDPDVTLLGDFNAYPRETPVTTLTGGGFSDLESQFLGAAAYSYLFDGQIGHLDYAFASAALLPQVTGVGVWHINADEIPDFNYNDEIADAGESAFEEKPDGSALVPPRVLFQPATPWRASDHDPVLVGLFQIADLAITKTDSPDPVTAGTNLTYTITVTNNGPDVAANATWTDTLPAGTTFVSLSAVAGWSCTTPAVGGGGTVSCSNASLAVGSANFTLTVAVARFVTAGTELSNTATIDSDAGDGTPANDSATATTTVGTSADLSVTKTDTPDPVNAGGQITYTITVTNAGPSHAAAASLTDTLPAGTTFVSLPAVAGWSCTTPPVGSGGAVNCTNPSFAPGGAVFTLTVGVDAGTADGTVISNGATVASTTSDPAPGNETGTATTTVIASADLSVTKTDGPDPVSPGGAIVYTITVTNAGPTAAGGASLSDSLPAGTTFVSLPAVAGWSCATPPVGGGGVVSCTNPSFAAGSAVFTLTVQVDPGVAGGTLITNSATVASPTPDPAPGGETGTATTSVAAAAVLSATKTVTGDFLPGGAIVYTIVISNDSAFPQPDLAGDELTDILPPELELVGASATSGTAVATVATNTVSWNGAIPAGGTVTITIDATISETAAPGTTIANQGTVFFDADGNGSNESSAPTDDPAVGGGADPTTIVVGSDTSVLEIPTLGEWGLVAFAVYLAGMALLVVRRRRN